MTPALVVSSLAAPLAAMLLGVGFQGDAAEAAPQSAIEAALTERACALQPSYAMADADARQRCTDAQLQLLRVDFGRDLRRLSTAERQSLDAACRPMQTTRGREGYLDCLNAQLVALRVGRSRAAVLPAAVAPTSATHTQASSPESLSAAAIPARAAGPGLPAATDSHRIAIAGGVLVTLGVVVGTSLLVVGKRRPRRSCHQCGVPTETGGLCDLCRHAAAEAMRRAAAERLEQVRADESERRARQRLEEDERQTALREAEARTRELETEQRRTENARRAQDERCRESQAVQSLRSAPDRAADPADEFDPYAVLGIEPGTGADGLRAAYERARSKYDGESVAHLGIDVQKHFKSKAEAIDRAYHMLAG